MGNDKGEACPPLQLKRGAQRHGCLAPHPRAEGLGVGLTKCCAWLSVSEVQVGRPAGLCLGLHFMTREDRGPERGRQLLRVTPQFGGVPRPLAPKSTPTGC